MNDKSLTCTPFSFYYLYFRNLRTRTLKITKVTYKMERPKGKRCKLDNSPKVLRIDIELLPNEILMNIFSNLSIKELLKCAQVSKKFRQISHDGSFWKCVNLYNQRVSCQFVAQLLHLGTEYLNLLGTTVLNDGDAVIPRKNNLKYLNLSVSSMEDKFLVRLLRSSVSLEKLSLAGVEKMKGGSNRPLKRIRYDEETAKLRTSWYVECLLPNARMLTTLDLSHVTGIIFCKLNSETMEEILLNCVELKEANFWGQIIDAEFFANNLTPKIEKLNISSNADFDGKQIVQLVKRCNNMTELDLAGCDVDVDFDNLEDGFEDFQNCLIAISENLSQSLVKLRLPNHSILCHEFLKSLPKLQNLWINNEDREDVKNFDMKQYPHIALNEGTAKIAYSTYEYFEPRQGFWEIKCTTIDFSKPQ